MIKILFLEDEETIAEVTAEYMRLKEYDVTCVSDAEEAIQAIQKEKFDLAILDIMVPKGSGFDILKYINEENLNIATIMLTALGDEKTQLEAFNMRADDYVIKPFSPLLLLKRIEAVLRRSMVNIKNKENIEGLYINDNTYEAFYDNSNLNLTLSEFLLLQALIRESNKAFTREQLILRIFDEDYYGSDRIIDAHVKNLRKKLPKNYIKTINGVGYQFNKEVK